MICAPSNNARSSCRRARTASAGTCSAWSATSTRSGRSQSCWCLRSRSQRGTNSAHPAMNTLGIPLTCDGEALPVGRIEKGRTADVLVQRLWHEAGSSARWDAGRATNNEQRATSRVSRDSLPGHAHPLNAGRTGVIPSATIRPTICFWRSHCLSGQVSTGDAGEDDSGDCALLRGDGDKPYTTPTYRATPASRSGPTRSGCYPF
jgi:hypothetical protein